MLVDCGSGKRCALLLSSPDTSVLDMSRDNRDAIVSSHCDEYRRNGFAGSFGDYYRLTGRFFSGQH
jgi:hypothetical protein